MTAPRGRSLSPEQLRWRCDPNGLGGASTRRIPPWEGWIGDERAREAVRLALQIGGRSHNLVLRGQPGSGRTALLRQCLGELESAEPADDLVYVERFDDPRRPRLLMLPPGVGGPFVARLDALADVVNELSGVPRAEALGRIRAALADLRGLAPSPAARRHITSLRAHILADLPLLRSDARDDEREAFARTLRATLLRETRGDALPVVEVVRAGQRAVLGSIDPPVGDTAPSVHDLHGGALVQSAGGVCVLRADDLDEIVARRLVATLRSGEVRLTPAPESSTPALDDYHPDPIPVQTRVVVLGDFRPPVLDTPSARRVFGVSAHCSAAFLWAEDTGRQIAGVTSYLVRREGLLHVRADGIARLVAAQVRDAEGKGLVSPRLGLLLDRLREADRVARQRDQRQIGGADVRAAVAGSRWRRGRVEERHRERLSHHRLRVRTTGSEVGTVNGLLVYTSEGYRYGAPTRITATTAVGREGLINVERESKLSGKTFDKGVFLLAGLLRARFCRQHPLGMVAMITFEQNYGRIDGDSAAAAELAAILSDLAGAPVRQGIALTGSLSQRGELQAVGGTNPKIEGFYATCKDRGRVREQGVIIPRSNVEDLVLDDEIVDAARDGRFSIWPADRIEEALELLTGIPAGEPDADGRYPPDTLLGRAQARLEQMSNRMFPPRAGGKKKRE